MSNEPEPQVYSGPCDAYANDLEFLDGLRAVIRAQRYMNKVLLLSEDPCCDCKPPSGVSPSPRETQAALRQYIYWRDAHRQRTAATREGSPKLRIDQLAARHQLSEKERAILEVVAAFKTSVMQAWGGFDDAELTIGSVARFLADWVSFEAQSYAGLMVPGAKLVTSGIIKYRGQCGSLDKWRLDLQAETLLKVLESTNSTGEETSPKSTTPVAVPAPLPSDIVAYRNTAGIVHANDAAESLAAMWGHVAHRDIIGKDWGFAELSQLPSSMCLLFYGPPGTGKTMTARTLGKALGKLTHVVAYDKLVNKYVGETEKAITAVFEQAAAADALLVFDEADAIFANRTVVTHSTDRFANGETNLLLMELERARGIVVLTTNNADNLDPALQRRLRYKVHFGPPGAEQRAEIWRKHIPAKAPLGADVDFDRLGREFELSGGQIANAVLAAAAAAAARITNPGDAVTILMADFEAAARRERSGYDEAGQKSDRIGF